MGAHNKKQYCGGHFDHEEDAAMKVNLLCDKYEIKRKNPTINIELNEIKQKVPKSNKTSQYIGVGWSQNKWYARLYVNGKQNFGGNFRNELDAAKRVNQL